MVGGLVWYVFPGRGGPPAYEVGEPDRKSGSVGEINGAPEGHLLLNTLE